MTTYIIIGSLLLLTIILSYFRNKRAKNKIVRVIDNNCTGCQRCVKKCRHKALEIVNSENGQLVVLKYPEKCTACRDCIIVCRFNALELVNRKQPEQAADTSIKRAKINAFVWDSLYGLSSRR